MFWRKLIENGLLGGNYLIHLCSYFLQRFIYRGMWGLSGILLFRIYTIKFHESDWVSLAACVRRSPIDFSRESILLPISSTLQIYCYVMV